MTANDFQKSGVAHVSILIILIFVTFHIGHCRPAASNYPLNMEPHSKTNNKPYNPKEAPKELGKLPINLLPWDKTTVAPPAAQGQKLFLATKNASWLEILPDGTIRGNTCKTKYGLLESRSHNLTVALKGQATGRYICMNSKGLLYTNPTFDPHDCGFLIKPRYENNGTDQYYTYGHHVHHGKRHGKNNSGRFHFGINCNGQTIVVSTREQRKKNKNYIRFYHVKENLNDKSIDDFPDTCEKSKCSPKKRKVNYLKFCKRIRKTFFQASLKDLRRFSKRNCWKKLSKARRKTKQPSKHRRRHRRRLIHSPHRYSADPT